MTNLAISSPRTTRGPLVVSSFPVTGGTVGTPKVVYAGSAVEEQADGGMDNALGVGTTFAGIALQNGTNTGGIGVGPNIEVATDGEFLLPVVVAGNVLRTNVGATVYVTDGNTFTLASGSAQAIGKVVEVPEDQVGLATGYLWVRVQGIPSRSI